RDKADLDGAGHGTNPPKIKELREILRVLDALRQPTSAPSRALPSVLLPIRRPDAKRPRGRAATSREILTMSLGCHGAAILLTDQRDGSERIKPAGTRRRNLWGPLRGLVAIRCSAVAGWDRAVTMGSIDKYIFRTTLASFALVLVSLTGVIWI